MFSITIEQKERQSSKVGVRSVLTLAEIAGIQYLVSYNFTYEKRLNIKFFTQTK